MVYYDCKEVKKVIRYKIDIKEALKAKGYNSTVILKENILSQSAMQKIRKGEVVGINVLNQLCDLLEMQPGEIIEFEKE